MRKISSVFFVISAFFLSCTEEIDDLSIASVSPTVSVPIGTFNVQADAINEIGGDFNVRENDDLGIEFFYDVEFLSSAIFDRFELRDQSFSQTVPFAAAAFSGGEVSVSSPDEFNSYTIQNTDRPESEPGLTRLELKAGTITISQQKNFDHELSTDIILPTLTKDGVALSVTLTDNQVFNESLEGYTLDLTGVNSDKVNTVEYDLEAIIRETGTSVLGDFEVSFSLEEVEFSYLEGDLRSYSFDQVQGEFEIGLPESDIPDNIRFTDPQLDLTALNSAGIPFALTINEIGVIDNSGDTAAITGSYLQENWVLEGAPTAGEFGMSNFSVSTANTDNLADFISNIPDRVFFDGILDANPNTSGVAQNFLTDTSGVAIEGQLILPLTGYVNNYNIVDTLNADLSISEEGGIDLENINLRIVSENAFGINIGIQLYFIDSTEASGDVVLDSLFASREESIICPAAQVDGNGFATDASTLLSDITIDREKYDRIRNTKKIRLVGTLLSAGADQTPPQSISITSDNYLTLKLGLSAQATVNPENL